MCFFKTPIIISMHLFKSSSDITSVGANLIIFPCVGFASNPLFFISIQISHAKCWFFELSTSIALSNPFPLTSLTILKFKMLFNNFSLKIFPKKNAFSVRFSSFITSRAAIETLHARGFPPKLNHAHQVLSTTLYGYQLK